MGSHRAREAADALLDAQLIQLLAALADLAYVIDDAGVIRARIEGAGTRIVDEGLDLVGRPAFWIVHPDCWAALAAALRARGGTVPVLRRVAEGTWREATVRVSVINDLLVVALNDDVAAADRARTQARADVRRLQAVLTRSREGHAVISADGTFLWLGPIAGEWGINAVNGIGLNMLGGLRDDDVPRVRGVLARVAAGAVGAYETVDAQWRLPSGQWRHVVATVTNMLHDPDVGGLILNVRDVTEQKVAELAVARREAMFAALLSHSLDLVLVFHLNGGLQYKSRSVDLVLGDMPDGYRFGDLTHLDERDQVLRAFQRVKADPGGSAHLEYRLRTADGSYRWMDVRLMNMADDPAVGGIVVACRDVTDRRRNDILLDGQARAMVAAAGGAPLTESLSLLCQSAEDFLSESEPAAVGVALPRADADGAPHFGGSAQLLWLYSARAFPRVEVADVLAHDDFRVWSISEHPVLRRSAARLAARGLHGVWTFPLYGADGDVLCVAFTLLPQARPPRDHERHMLARMNELAWLLISRDAAAQDLRASEARFRSAFTNTGVPSAILSPDGRFEDVNAAMCALFGFPRAELLGKSFHWLHMPGQPDEHWSAGPPDNGDAYPPTELRMRHSDGGPLQVVVHAAVLRDDQGRVRNVVAHYLDMTEQRAGEEEVRLLNDLLSQRITELYHAQERLTASFREVTQAREDERKQLALALHDGAVQNLVATLWSLDDLDVPDGDESVATVAGQLRASIESVRKMIFELRPPILDAEGLVPAVEQELTALESATGISSTLDADLPTRPPSDVESLAFRTVREALQNVRKHARASAVRVQLGVDGSTLVVRVVDDGVGFDPQAAAARRDAGHYGVVSIQESIALAGGEVYLGNRRDGGRGTELDMRLPVQMARSEPAAGLWGETMLSPEELLDRAIRADRAITADRHVA